MIEKLVKEFQKIRTSLAKSKKLIVADIDKIDEKYRKLAQEEKKSLTESLAVLNEQLKYYDKMLDGEPIVEETDEKSEYVEPDPIEEAPEMKIQDTIFPENNVEEEKTEETTFETTYPEKQNEHKEETKTVEESDATDVVPADSSATTDDVAVEWPDNAVVEKKEVKKEEEPVAVFTTDDNGWPEYPDDWK